MKGIAIVKEIQVGGLDVCNNLEKACSYLLDQIAVGNSRVKLNFTVKLPSGEIKSITIRDEDNETVAYGDFEGLPSMLDYAREMFPKMSNRREPE